MRRLCELVTPSRLDQLEDVIRIVRVTGRSELAKSLGQWREQLQGAIDSSTVRTRSESWWG